MLFTIYAQLKQLLSMKDDASKAAELVVNGGKSEADPKDITVVFPPIDKSDYPTTYRLSMTNNDELRDFVTTHKGNLIDKTGIKLRHQQLEDDGVYTLFGPSFMGFESDSRTLKVRNKMREVHSLLTLKKELEGSREMFFNIMIHGHASNEVLIHKEDSEALHATAFICETAFVPTTHDVEALKDKVSKFETMTKSREQFQSVNKMVPVLSGHDWKPEVLKRAKAAGMWTVRTGGDKYRVVRGFCSVARRLK